MFRNNNSLHSLSLSLSLSLRARASPLFFMSLQYLRVHFSGYRWPRCHTKASIFSLSLSAVFPFPFFLSFVSMMPFFLPRSLPHSILLFYADVSGSFGCILPRRRRYLSRARERERRLYYGEDKNWEDSFFGVRIKYDFSVVKGRVFYFSG